MQFFLLIQTLLFVGVLEWQKIHILQIDNTKLFAERYFSSKDQFV
jgi:hypothetical protein